MAANMLKPIGAFCVITLLTSAAHSHSVPESLPIEPVDFVCYVEDSSGQLTDLTKLCGAGRISAPRAVGAAPAAPTAAPTAPAAAPTSRSAVVLSPETNLGGLNIGGEDGAPLCFGFDAQGRACP
jgi:hypothetical protein